MTDRIGYDPLLSKAKYVGRLRLPIRKDPSPSSSGSESLHPDVHHLLERAGRVGLAERFSFRRSPRHCIMDTSQNKGPLSVRADLGSVRPTLARGLYILPRPRLTLLELIEPPSRMFRLEEDPDTPALMDLAQVPPSVTILGHSAVLLSHVPRTNPNVPTWSHAYSVATVASSVYYPFDIGGIYCSRGQRWRYYADFEDDFWTEGVFIGPPALASCLSGERLWTQKYFFFSEGITYSVPGTRLKNFVRLTGDLWPHTPLLALAHSLPGKTSMCHVSRLQRLIAWLGPPTKNRRYVKT